MPELKRQFKLGELLINSGRITQDQLEAGLKRSRDNGTMLGETFVEMNLIQPLELLRIVGQQKRRDVRNVPRQAAPLVRGHRRRPTAINACIQQRRVDIAR